ncbi:RimK family alpha-L-glutamate ligase [Notoacmeibacter sp. MSK16QG-6]|uniref:ATP-grasp domain-containing protein n=1 Tax=Notoacmeibacter sp. MSK16QG-6 TaxID=2957982 RepID=UPI0020A03627|nr:hypothetical protein [Notoacmeibacter sp. MSK16QG-6]MCP1200177.1 hypothetical protein [Notoacmeibacter sp. MSK16QG-6]
MEDRNLLLIAGGRNDVSLIRLYEEARSAGVDVAYLDYTQPGIGVTYDPSTARLVVDGRTVNASAVFFRMEYFQHGRSRSREFLEMSHAFYSVVEGWTIANPHIRSFAKGQTRLCALNKPLGLTLAKKHGLTIPRTVISNEAEALSSLLQPDAGIAKPVNGGDYVLKGEKAASATSWRKGKAPQPAIVQQRLVYPEYRIYVIGEQSCTFEVRSTDLDYRQRPNYTLRHVPDGPPDPTIIPKLRRVADEFGLAFSASDLKTNPQTGQIEFLEINSMPMFAAYDKASGGALNRAILSELKVLRKAAVDETDLANR